MASGETLDFELEIEAAGADGLFQVNVLNAPGGDASAHLDPAALPFLPPGSPPPATLQDARTLGGDLFNALFTGDIRSRYDVSRRLAAAQKAALRLRLRIEPPAVAALPWELLFDARADEFLALSRATPVVRYIPSAEPVQPLTVTGPLHVLAMGASPADLPPVDVAQERVRVEAALAPLRRTRKVTLTWLEGQTAEALRQALQSGEYHAFHYVGHARLNPESGAGELLLAGADGQADPLDATTLRGLLRDHGSLRLAVLAACEGARSDEAAPFASLAGQLVQAGLPAVVAMQREISTEAAGAFTSGFYGALASSLPLDAAVAEARKAMRAAPGGQSSSEWATPALFLRARDGRIWVVRRRTGRLLAVAAAAALVLAVALGLLTWNWLLPTFFPTTMPGFFDIAVAEIGVLGANGRQTRSELGSSISRALYETLQDTYADYQAAVAALPARGPGAIPANRMMSIWHDSLGRGVKNVTFGMMDGATAEERQAEAAELAQHVGAEVVVYGYIIEGQPNDEVVLEFYYATPRVDGEPDATAGNHSLGLPIAYNPNNADRASLNLAPAITERSQILFWITQGLAYLLNNQPEEAVTLLNAADARIRWSSDNGRDLFEVVRGQAALLARDLPLALAESRAAVERNPEWLNALLLRGQVLYDWAQLYYLRGVEIPAEQAACYNLAGVEASAATLEEARAAAAEAVAVLSDARTRAEAMTPTRLTAQALTFIHMSLGLAWRVVGYTEADSGNLAAAAEAYARSAAAFDAALDRLGVETQPQYVGWTLAGLAATQEAQWDLLEQEAQLAQDAGNLSVAEDARAASLPFLRAAVDAYQACVDLAPATQNNPIFQARVLECACRPFLLQSQETLRCLEGGPCSQ